MKTKISKTTISYIVITAFVSVGFICLAVFVFRRSYVRLYESCYDLGNSFWYYILRMCGKNSSFTPSVTTIPDNFYNFRWLIPQSSGYFGTKMGFWWSEIWRSSNLGRYTRSFFTSFSLVLDSLIIVVLFGLIIWLLFRRYFTMHLDKEGNPITGDSHELVLWNRFILSVYMPVKEYVLGYCHFIKCHRWIWRSWLVLWALNFNLFVICIEVLAFYFYFVCTFDFVNLYIQVYKLFGDLTVIVRFIPAVIWVILIFGFLYYRRFKKGYKKLDNLEARNKIFLTSLGQVNMIYGAPGIGKTRVMTDMILSTSQYFRYKANEFMSHDRRLFPNFPWANYENEIRMLMSEHLLYNLSTCKRWINDIASSFYSGLDFDKRTFPFHPFGYDVDHNKIEFFDGMNVVYLFDVLESYVKLYFIYSSPSPIITSNYSIRDDTILIDRGTHPSVDYEFFRSKADRPSMYSHILMQDMMRLNKTVNPNNPFNNSLEFGVIGMTEVAKERLNSLQTKEMHLNSDSANQVNDGFNNFLKLVRHSATVDHFCFAKFFLDDQRAMSVNADLRELCESVITISSCVPDYSVLSFRKWELRFLNFVSNLFGRWSDSFFAVRNDRTLFSHFCDSISSLVTLFSEKFDHIFGFDLVTLSLDNGNLIYKEGEKPTQPYYLLHKKINSNRYSSTTYEGFWNYRASRSSVGENDIPMYGDVVASAEELALQDSYFLGSLFDTFVGDNHTDGCDETESHGSCQEASPENKE